MSDPEQIEPARNMRSRIRQCYFLLKMLVVGALTVMAFSAVYVYYRDSNRLNDLAVEIVDDIETPSEQMRSVAQYVAREVPSGRPDDYVLLPIFRFMKPTACQVIDQGGDCAYRARACIVLLNQLDIESTKLCLHDAEGIPRHAVARVQTERGVYIVDLSFGICYEHEDGSPMSLSYIVENLPSILEAQVSRGNEKAKKYPIQRYPFTNVTTINWEKNDNWRAVRNFLQLFMDDEKISQLNRPYIAEEPALMVLLASLGGIVLLILPGPIWRWIKRRRSKRSPVPNQQ